MNKKELIDRLKLTPEEFMECAKNIPYTTEVDKAGWAWIFGARLIEAQLNKIINDPDIAFIDRERELPKNPHKDVKGWGYEYRKSQQDMLEARYLPVIPLSELEEVNDGNQGS